MTAILKNNLDTIKDLCKKHHVNSLYVFGSAAREKDFNENSDIDLLYEFDLKSFSWKDERYDYIDNLNDFEKNLTDIFKRKIDLIRNSRFNNHSFKDKVANNKQLLYAK